MAVDTDSFESGDDLPRIVAVSLQPTGHLYNYLAGELALKRGDRVLVDGEAACASARSRWSRTSRPYARPVAMRPVVRLAEARRLRAEEENLDREARARRLCVERIRERGLPMKLVKVDYHLRRPQGGFLFHRRKAASISATWCATWPIRLRVRVEMKQIGARDETKVTGGVGPVRARIMLLVVAARLRGRHGQDGARAGAGAQSVASGRDVRPAQVLPALRVRDLHRTQARTARPSASACNAVKGDGKVLRQNIFKQTVLIQLDEDGGVVEATLDDMVRPARPSRTPSRPN